MNIARLRARNKEDRKVYQENSQMAVFTDQFKDKGVYLDEVDDTALINVLRSLNPGLIVDERHNAESKLSGEMLKNLNPSFILDLTATPKQDSHIVSLIPATELKKENMVKRPVIVYNNHDRTEVVNTALHPQTNLANPAKEEDTHGGNYLRPMVSFQA